MCSISGIINFMNKSAYRDAIKRMCDAASHRGPDGQGYVFSSVGGKDKKFSRNPEEYKKDTEANFALGHRRLKIIDLSLDAEQPMSNEDGSLWIVYNGEVYNYIELKKELKSKGHRFKSASDTEVILHAYEEYGDDCVSRFNGMWSFVIMDIKKNEFFCSRDRLGQKPFFYYYNEHKKIFIFSSEIKSLLSSGLVERAPDHGSVYAYLARDIGYANYYGKSFFKGVSQLKGGHNMKIREKGIEIRRYWSINFSKESESSEESLIDGFLEIFRDSVSKRLRSDVEVASYLSGGLDSSSVTACAASLLDNKRLTTFSSCFEDPAYDEREYINAVSEKYNINPVHVFPSPSKLFKELPELIYHQEEPFLHLNVYSQWQIMKDINEKGFKVVLNGHGGDEGLAGYIKDFIFYFADILKKMRLTDFVRELRSFDAGNYGIKKNSIVAGALRINLTEGIPGSIKKGLKKINNRLNFMDPGFREANNCAVRFNERTRNFLSKSSSMGYSIYPVPEWLKYEDRASMAYSIESRSPFLDHRLIEFMTALPNSSKIRGGMSKYILREAMKGILPEKVRLRKDKKGFPTPSANWFKDEFKTYVQDIINSGSFAKRGIFDVSKIRSLFNDHINGKVDLKFEVWSWVNVELWMRKFFDSTEN